MKFKKIILASKSPRRRFLLDEANLEFEVKAKDVEESYPDELDVNEVAEYLAKKKAYASKDFLEKDSVLLTADSIVTLGDKIYGKPENADHAFQILSELSGKEHKVITGVCMISEEKEISFSSVSIVQFEPLSEEEIWFYINKFKPFDKAGAYAIQEWIGLTKITKIEGLYSNIMGLPIADVYKALAEF